MDLVLLTLYMKIARNTLDVLAYSLLLYVHLILVTGCFIWFTYLAEL